MIFHIIYDSDGSVSLPDGSVLGVFGEHNATSLEITLPQELLTDIDYCVAAFQAGVNTIRSAPIYESEEGSARRSGTTVYLDVWEQVMSHPRVCVQLEMYKLRDGRAVRVAKTVPTPELTVIPGVCGEELAMDRDPSFAAALAGQLHQNFNVLSAISREDAALALDGVRYAVADHDHDGSYSAPEHSHDGSYSALGHNHDGSYSALEHHHNDRYSSHDHTHNELYPSIFHLHDGIYQRKREGYGLSVNNLSNQLKERYDSAYEHSVSAHAPSSAQMNVLESVKINGSALTPDASRAVNIDVPELLSASALSACTVNNVASPAVNRRYTASISGTLTFSLPAPAAPLAENVIVVYAQVAQGASIIWGASDSILYYNGEIPIVGEGSYEFIFIYNPALSKWTIGVLPVAGVGA